MSILKMNDRNLPESLSWLYYNIHVKIIKLLARAHRDMLRKFELSRRQKLIHLRALECQLLKTSTA